jgi:divalent metal cation (Fe/Co/Zn/Cd) transporter
VTDQERLLRRGLTLEYVTLAWNIFEAAIVLWSAWLARSIGLAGFGLDSLIEIFASIVVVWQLKGIGDDRQPRAMRLISIAFFLVAAYIVGQLGFSLISSSHPGPSLLGLASLAATMAVMLTLAWAKHATGRALGNKVLMAEARVTLIDAGLALAVFIGVGLNTLFGWWWADPLSGVVLVFYAVKEGREAWEHSHGEHDAG